MLVTKHKRLISGDPSRWFSATVGRMRLADSRSSRLEASDRVCDKPLLAVWAESFIFAGSSAILLLIANLFSSCWYFSFFALAPFLYRIIKAAPIESLRLGSLLGLSFFGAFAVNSLTANPFASVVKLLSGTALFALFGWSVGLALHRFGFNLSIVAVLWVGLELGLPKLGFVSGILGKGGLSHSSLHGLVGLFGFLAASAIIVLLNSLLVLAIVRTLEVRRTDRGAAAESRSGGGLFFDRNLCFENIYLVPEGRGPPFVKAPQRRLSVNSIIY